MMNMVIEDYDRNRLIQTVHALDYDRTHTMCGIFLAYGREDTFKTSAHVTCHECGTCTSMQGTRTILLERMARL